MKYLLAFGLVSFSLYLSAQTITGTLMHDGIERNYRIHIPDGYDAAQTWPLVFNLHGFGSNALEQEFYSGMSQVADDEGFFVCYPNGVDEAWNVGWSFGSTEDDVGFISALIDELSTTYNIDAQRVYSCGMSNGGFMSYVLACELNDKVTAVASVTGSMVPTYLPTCEPGRAVPVMEIHGTADAVVPYNGSDIAAAIPDVLDFWATNNGCSEPPIMTDVPDTNTGDGSTAVRIEYVSCTIDSAVVHYRVDEGGHTWPGSPIVIGVTNQDFSASRVIWEFFDRFSLDMFVSSFEPFAQEAVSLYPNPVQDRLYLNSPTLDWTRYELYDNQARLLRRAQLGSGQTYLSTQELTAGVYYLRLWNGTVWTLAKFVK